MPDNNFRFAFDFFFTDLPNQVEFLKWTRGLGKDDDVLLVAALEAMYMHTHLSKEPSSNVRTAKLKQHFWEDNFDASTASPSRDAPDDDDEEEEERGEGALPLSSNSSTARRMQRGQSFGMVGPTGGVIGSSASAARSDLVKPMLDNKHPYNLIEVYANLKKLDGHEFNVIEFAYLDGGWRHFESIWDLLPPCSYKWSQTQIRCWTALLSFVSQYAFSSILFVWHVSNSIEVLYERDSTNAFNLLIVIAAVSTIVFWNIAAKQWQDCIDFNGIDGSHHWADTYHGSIPFWVGRILLTMNFLVNVVLGPPLVIFNVYFVLTSENPTEGILNAVALGFVLEVDDLLSPSWDADMIEDATANLFHEYISEPFPGEDEQFSHMGFVRNPGKIPYSDGDKLYIKVPETIAKGATGFDITVFRSNTEFEGGTTPTDDYQAITYKISGNDDYIGIFHERVRAFYCVQNFDDFKVQTRSLQMMRNENTQRGGTRRRGTRRGRSTRR